MNGIEYTKLESSSNQENTEPIIEEVEEEEVKMNWQGTQSSRPLQDKHKPGAYEQHKGEAPKKGHTEGGSRFECNICLELANEPVVSTCGHLYCWTCIYEWMKQPKETLVCPVCKSGISKESLIPIYTKANTEDPRKKAEIPKRPVGQR